MAARHPPRRTLKPKEKDYKVTDRDGMYIHVTAKGAMSFWMDCQPMSWLRSTMQPSRPGRNGHPISTALRFRSRAKDPERVADKGVDLLTGTYTERVAAAQ